MDYQYKSPKKSQWGMSLEQDGEEEEGNDFTQDFVPPPTPADEKRQELMREYLTTQHQKKQAGLDKYIDDAKTQSKYAGYGDVIGKLVTDYGNSQRQPQQFANRLQDLGKVHQETKPEKSEWQSIQPMFDKNVANAKQAKADSFADMERGIKAKQYGQAEAGMDAGSDLSKKAQMLAKAVLLSKAKEAELAGDADGASALKSMDVSGMSAMEAKEFYDGLKNSDYKDVLASQTAQANRDSQADYIAAMRDQTAALRSQNMTNRNEAAEEKKAEAMEQLRIGDLGYAQTKEDAKQLKDAIETKSSFDSKLDELIKLREDKGVEYLDREAVARGRQLSKELLLDYKNLAKLGVLSQSDEAIINAIIPTDPLGQDFAAGQDPILSNLKKWKSDLGRDYQTKLNNRLRKKGRSEAVSPESSSSKPAWAK